MILSKSILHSCRAILVVLKNHQTVSTNSFHHLRPITRTKLTSVNAIVVPELCGIISRFESSQAAQGKDVILQVPAESLASKIPNKENASTVVTDNIPDIPVAGIVDDLPEIVAEAAVPLNKLGEATLQSIGLGSAYTPIGWVQRAVEYLHVTFEIPWWSSIAICVVCARLALFPLVIKHQRHTIHMHNAMPEMTALQSKLQNAKMYGNHVEVMKIGHDLALFMEKNQVSPVKTMVMPFVQAPIFLSFFWGLRRMASAPVESFKQGGALWFTDLTVCDEFFALPAITCITLWLTLELGADFSKTPSASVTSRYMPYIMRALPVVIFPFIINFPTAVCVYWASTNFVSLIQVAILRIPTVREYFQIPEKNPTVKTEMKKSRKGFVKDIKSSFGTMKVAKEIAERERLDAANFKRAGRQPPAKTFKYNPLLTSQTVQAKKQ